MNESERPGPTDRLSGKMPFTKAGYSKADLDPLAIMRRIKCTMDVAHKTAARLRRQDVFRNDKYQVAVVDTEWPGVGKMKYLSVKRIDKQPIHDWRDLQRIKNELVGPECEGLELYPAESRLNDEANQYHIFVFVDPKIKIPLGYDTRRIMDTDEAAALGAGQRPLAE